MAWRSSGSTNDEMVDNLKRFGVIHSSIVEDGFRAVDRRFFVPQDRQSVAHSDQPLKQGNVHISAPHIYGTVTEALELHVNSSMSFLNLGSGTGYLSCIVAAILGPTSSHYAVELHADVVQHCRESIQRWTTSYRSSSSSSSSSISKAVAPIEVIHGNALDIDTTKGESLVGFDRIYIGAAVDQQHLRKFANLLKPNGILVGPVDDELVKIIRFGNSNSNNERSTISSSSVTDDSQGTARSLISRLGGGVQQQQQSTQLSSSDFAQQVISNVRFAPLSQQPTMVTIIPSKVWEPSIHHYYPDSFRKACRQILLCSRASPLQPPPPPPATTIGATQERVNVACILPRAIWMEILSYTHRDWFEKTNKSGSSEEEFLRRRLMEAQAAVQRAQHARSEAETRLQMAERERDIYRLLAMRWQARLQALARNNRAGSGRVGNGEDDDNIHANEDGMIGMDDIAAAASAVFANEPIVLRLGGLDAVIRRFHRDAESSSDDDDDDDDDLDIEEQPQQQQEHNVEDAVMVDLEDMDDTASVHAAEVNNGPESMAVPSDPALSARPQVRSVSITSDDL